MDVALSQELRRNGVLASYFQMLTVQCSQRVKRKNNISFSTSFIILLANGTFCGKTVSASAESLNTWTHFGDYLCKIKKFHGNNLACSYKNRVKIFRKLSF